MILLPSASSDIISDAPKKHQAFVIGKAFELSFNEGITEAGIGGFPLQPASDQTAKRHARYMVYQNSISCLSWQRNQRLFIPLTDLTSQVYSNVMTLKSLEVKLVISHHSQRMNIFYLL